MPPFCGPACSTVYTGTLDGLRKIVRTEGAAVLWRGTDVALLMAIPMVRPRALRSPPGHPAVLLVLWWLGAGKGGAGGGQEREGGAAPPRPLVLLPSLSSARRAESQSL